jgi:hypothetical protein
MLVGNMRRGDHKHRFQPSIKGYGRSANKAAVKNLSDMVYLCFKIIRARFCYQLLPDACFSIPIPDGVVIGV